MNDRGNSNEFDKHSPRSAPDYEEVTTPAITTGYNARLGGGDH